MKNSEGARSLFIRACENLPRTNSKVSEREEEGENTGKFDGLQLVALERTRFFLPFFCSSTSSLERPFGTFSGAFTTHARVRERLVSGIFSDANFSALGRMSKCFSTFLERLLCVIFYSYARLAFICHC